MRGGEADDVGFACGLSSLHYGPHRGPNIVFFYMILCVHRSIFYMHHSISTILHTYKKNTTVHASLYPL